VGNHTAHTTRHINPVEQHTSAVTQLVHSTSDWASTAITDHKGCFTEWHFSRYLALAAKCVPVSATDSKQHRHATSQQSPTGL